jgi:DNA repair protein RecO (recombination protein O)
VGLYRDQGVVLRTVKLGEADRIITLLTQVHGKVRAVAKGIRKPGSRFGARLEPTSHVALQLYEGRSLDVITQVETIDVLRPIRECYEVLTHAVTMLEVVDQVAQERERNHALYRMLVGALRTLSERPAPLVTPAFLWKLLGLEGFSPVLDECAGCGAAADTLVTFDLAEGGGVCRACSEPGAPAIEPETFALLRRILGGEVRIALAEPDGPAARQVEWLSLRAVEYHLERKLRSAALIERH